MTSTKQDPLAEYQSRVEYLEAQGRLMERHLQSESPLSAEDVADLGIIIKRALVANDYTLNELEDLRLKKGRIYGRANVTSTKTNDGDMTRHHTAAISFHTDYAYSVVFDDHKIGGDEWVTISNNTIYTLTYSAAKQRLYMNNVEIYRTKASNADLVLRTTFKAAGVVKECAEFVDKYGHTRNDANYSIKTKQVISNIKKLSEMPDCLDFIFSSFDDNKGMKIITKITEQDIIENKVDVELVDSWLASK
ncbi:MAG: hypothetical protein RBR82_17915 [Pseudomonas sp.]|nr:hypothetical protein [Pseudomonas sp.]